MDIDLNTILSSFELSYLENYLRSVANSRLSVAYSSCRDEKTQKAVSAMQNALKCEIFFSGSTLQFFLDIDLPKEFQDEYSTMKDQLEHEISTVANLFLEGEVRDILEWPDVQQRITESVQPQIIEEISSMLGGIIE